jgi:DNA adenine methylase
MKTPLRYAGGKSRAIKHISYLAKDEKTIISPFLGGGSLEIHWASLGKKVIGYDIFDVLVNFWNVLLNKNDELVLELKKIAPTNNEYKRVKEELMKTSNTQKMLENWKTNTYKRTDIVNLNDVELAAYYYFNHNCSYGPGYLGWGSSVYLKESKWNNMISDIEKFKVSDMQVRHDSFENVLPIHNSEFIYLDPPYYTELDSDNKMHAAIYPMKNIPVHHDGFNHELLRDLLKNHKGKFVLSYNNCETIRDYYSEFNQSFPSWNYSMGNGETRIGKNRKEMGISNSKESHEILITNFDYSFGEPVGIENKNINLNQFFE